MMQDTLFIAFFLCMYQCFQSVFSLVIWFWGRNGKAAEGKSDGQAELVSTWSPRPSLCLFLICFVYQGQTGFPLKDPTAES